jgi:hypothetical protein
MMAVDTLMLAALRRRASGTAYSNAPPDTLRVSIPRDRASRP